MAQRVKNPPTGQEPWIRSLGQEDSPGGEKWQPIPVFLPEKNPMDRGAWWATVHRLAKSQRQLRNEIHIHRYI